MASLDPSFPKGLTRPLYSMITRKRYKVAVQLHHPIKFLSAIVYDVNLRWALRRWFCISFMWRVPAGLGRRW